MTRSQLSDKSRLTYLHLVLQKHTVSRVVCNSAKKKKKKNIFQNTTSKNTFSANCIFAVITTCLIRWRCLLPLRFYRHRHEFSFSWIFHRVEFQKWVNIIFYFAFIANLFDQDWPRLIEFIFIIMKYRKSKFLFDTHT